jgi:ribose-phosphate pyrophosphokinase
MAFLLLAGTSHPALALDLANELGVTLGAASVERFPDGELDVDVTAPVRHRECFIVQSLHAPVGEHLLELALLSDACHRQGAESVTAVVPYLGYARQDRREVGSEPLGARVMGELIAAAHVDRVVCLDLHSKAVEGCFPKPVEHAAMMPALIEHVRARLTAPSVVVSPDLGAVKRAEAFARPLGLPVAVVHKQRLSGAEVQAHGIVGRRRRPTRGGRRRHDFDRWHPGRRGAGRARRRRAGTGDGGRLARALRGPRGRPDSPRCPSRE